MNQQQQRRQTGNQRSLRMYALAQTLAVIPTWGWLAVLWTVAIFLYSPGQFEWWLLVGSGFAGAYGLRPNLERAIDTAWLEGITDTRALGERFAQMRPIKQRVALISAVAMLGLLSLAFLVSLAFGF
jgi:hypothetical protein